MDKDSIEMCATCKWYTEHEGVCTNGESENCADFTSDSDCCELWEATK